LPAAIWRDNHPAKRIRITILIAADRPSRSPRYKRLNKEVKRRADVVGIFPNEAAIIRLVGAVLLEQNDEWQTQHRYMQTKAMAELTPAMVDAMPSQITTAAAETMAASVHTRISTTLTDAITRWIGPRP